MCGKMENTSLMTRRRRFLIIGDFDRILNVSVPIPLLRVAVEGSDNPIIQSNPARRPFQLASRGTTLSGDIQRFSMLLEVYKCVQLSRWFVFFRGWSGVVGFVDFV